MKPVRTFLLLGARWAIKFTARKMFISIKPDGEKEVVKEGLDGAVRHDLKRIWVSTETEGRDRLETIIHEVIHAAFPWMREWIVWDFAHDLAKLLWRLGYRDINTITFPDER